MHHENIRCRRAPFNNINLYQARRSHAAAIYHISFSFFFVLFTFMKKLLLTLLLALTIGGGIAWAAENKADLSTMGNANSSYSTRTSTNGWVASNAALVSIDNTVAPTLNGKTTAVGKLTSPLLSDGITTLSFKYANTFSESKGVSLKISIIQDGATVATDTLTKANSDVTQKTIYTFTSKDFSISGDFSIEILNLSPSNSTSNKDRVSIWDITWQSNSDPNALAAPTISNDEGIVSITNNAEGSTVYYSVNNETCDAKSTPYTKPFPVEYGDVVRAISIAGEKSSKVAEATITWQKTKYASLGEFLTDKPAHVVTFTCPLTAIYQNGQNLYVTDGTDYILVYGDVKQTYTNGDIIPAGAKGSFKDYQDTYEMENVADFGTPTSGTPVEAKVITTADITEAIGNHYVVIKEATLTSSKITDAAGEAVAYDKFKKNLTGTDVDVYGFITIFTPKGDTKQFQLCPIEIKESIGNNTPEQVVSDPVAVNDDIEIVRGESITFSSRYAAKLKIEVDGQAEPIITESNEYVYKPTEASTITVTPIGADGNEYADCALVVSVSFKAAPVCGAVTFDPADGTAVFPGSTVTIVCENAVKIIYVVGNGEEVTVDGASAQVTINEACTITAYGVNADGIDSDIAEASYTIKEADKYALVNHIEDVKEGAQYILLGATLSSKTYKLMGAKNGTYRNAISYSSDNFPEIISTNESDLAVFTINAIGENKYSIKIGEEYLGCVNNTATSGQNLSYADNANDTKFQFEISFDGDKCNIITGSQAIRFNNDRFKTYAKTNTSMSPVYLYRLIDEEYAAAPEAMYIHGHFWDRYYKFDDPVEMTAEEGGKVFTATNILIGGNSEAIADGKPLSYVFSDAKAESAAPESRAADETIDWSAINGNVYHQNGVTHTADTEKHAEIEPFEASEGHYDFTADFSGFAPKFTVTENTTTGVENIAIDASEAEYFNLQGVHVAEPTNGIYIRRQGKTVTKVFVK